MVSTPHAGHVAEQGFPWVTRCYIGKSAGCRLFCRKNARQRADGIRIYYCKLHMTDTGPTDDLEEEIAGEELLARELACLFGKDIVEQARLLDIADLNLTDDMTTAIGDGVRHLKQLKHDPEAQQQWVNKQEPGLQLLLCMWVMDMDLLDKIQTRSWL